MTGTRSVAAAGERRAPPAGLALLSRHIRQARRSLRFGPGRLHAGHREASHLSGGHAARPMADDHCPSRVAERQAFGWHPRRRKVCGSRRRRSLVSGLGEPSPAGGAPSHRVSLRFEFGGRWSGWRRVHGSRLLASVLPEPFEALVWGRTLGRGGLFGALATETLTTDRVRVTLRDHSCGANRPRLSRSAISDCP